MKRTKPMLCMAAALTLGMAACSDDINNSGGNGGVLEADEVRYLQVAISDAHAGTRAASFDPGTAAENKVENVNMMFYDQEGKFIKQADGKDITWTPANGNDGQPGNVEKKGTAIVTINLQKNQKLPAYVVCFINPVQWDLTESHNMQDLRDKERPNYKDGHDNYAMSNSAYFGTNILTGENDVKISGTPIPQGYLLNKMPTGSEPAGTVKTLDIYVERYAAKVQFTMETGEGTGTGDDEKGLFPQTRTTNINDTETATYTLNFKPKAWAINADAPTMFAIKKFALEENGPVPTLDKVQTYMGGWNNPDGTAMWNDPTNFRSYWSCSPAFFATDFPRVSDQIADKVTEGTGAGEAIDPYKLKYYSYNQIAGTSGTSGNGNTSFAAATDGTLPTMYALENTVGREAVKSLNPKAAVPSVLVVGEYEITAGTTKVTAGTTFYLYKEQLYFKDAPAGGVAAALIKDKLIADQQILYVRSGDTYTLLNGENATDANKGKLVVKHPDNVIRKDILVPHRYVTLQLSDVEGADLYYRPNGVGAYTKVTSTNINAVNTLLWQQVGVAEAYTNGKCYYSIPIHHLRMSEDTNGTPLKADKSIDWDKLRVGDMGLVRNHVYRINVKAIKGMATGIENPNYPIVPPMDADDYYVKYQINILGWRVVPTQENIIL